MSPYTCPPTSSHNPDCRRLMANTNSGRPMVVRSGKGRRGAPLTRRSQVGLDGVTRRREGGWESVGVSTKAGKLSQGFRGQQTSERESIGVETVTEGKSHHRHHNNPSQQTTTPHTTPHPVTVPYNPQNSAFHTAVVTSAHTVAYHNPHLPQCHMAMGTTVARHKRHSPRCTIANPITEPHSATKMRRCTTATL